MLKHFLKITFSSIRENVINTLITLFGLSIGLTCTIIIALWVKYELSYDRFHENPQDLYKAAFSYDPQDFMAYILPASVARYLKEEYPDIKNTTVFIKWVAIAFIIATPIAYYTMNNWLQNFAYKTTLSWWVFALAGAAALFVSLVTVSWISWKAATRNPVDAFRYE